MKTKTILLFTLAILTITVTIKAQNIPNYLPINGLVGWWPFNGNANDESGNGNDGVVNGASLTTDRFGILNKAYNFDGLTNYIQAPSTGQFTTNSITINGWMKIQNIISSGIQFIVCGNQSSASWSLVYNNLGFGDIINQNCSNPSENNFGQTPSADQWINITYVITPSSISFYKNGNLINAQNNLAFTASCGNNNLYFGLDIIGLQEYYSGSLDDIAIWNRALTPQEITALYTASSSNNNESSNTTANVPGAISYQAVARDAQGMPLADANLQVQFTLITDSISGAAEYEEIHTLSTNSLGLFTTALGAGTPVSNTFGNINWSAGNKFLKVQIDTGNGWMDMGTQQLLSTPYSMHSATSGAIKNPGLPVFADNAAALAGGLVAGDMYRTASGDLKIVY